MDSASLRRTGVALEVGIGSRDGPDVLGSVELLSGVLVVAVQPDHELLAAMGIRQPVLATSRTAPRQLAFGGCEPVPGRRGAALPCRSALPPRWGCRGHRDGSTDQSSAPSGSPGPWKPWARRQGRPRDPGCGAVLRDDHGDARPQASWAVDSRIEGVELTGQQVPTMTGIEVATPTAPLFLPICRASGQSGVEARGRAERSARGPVAPTCIPLSPLRTIWHLLHVRSGTAPNGESL